LQATPDFDSTSRYDERILRALRRIIRAVDFYSRQLSMRHSLTGPQLICLRQLKQHGELTPGQLARAVSLSPATISGILDRLERRGYLTRKRRAEDKRQVLVALTKAGMELVDRTPLPLQERFIQRLAELPEARQAEIDRVLQRIVTMMEAEEIDAAPVLASWPTGNETPETASRRLDQAPGTASSIEDDSSHEGINGSR